VVENQDSAVDQLDFLGFSSGAQIDAIRVGIRRISGTIEPVETGFVDGDL
jgi:hypothetical protein